MSAPTNITNTEHEWMVYYYQEARRDCLEKSKDKRPSNRYARELAAEQCLLKKADLIRFRTLQSYLPLRKKS